jgi:protocatechuate 3,4-dioxygenase beta subunit
MSNTAGGMAASPPPSIPAPPTMCILSPEETEGPFYESGQMMRKDITDGRMGVPFKLRARIVDVSASCAPLAGIAFEIWHCDADGVYSGPKAGMASETFLRGTQMTDELGVAEFDTIYPGWYSGRAVHIHFKVHVAPNRVATSQLYFDEEFSRELYGSKDPYQARGTTFQENATDVFANGYMDLMPEIKAAGDGYVGDIVIGINMA